MTLSSSPTREELLEALHALKSEQRRIDNAIAAIEVFLRTQCKPDMEGIARYEPGRTGAARPSLGRKAARQPAMVIQFPMRPERRPAASDPLPLGTENTK